MVIQSLSDFVAGLFSSIGPRAGMNVTPARNSSKGLAMMAGLDKLVVLDLLENMDVLSEKLLVETFLIEKRRSDNWSPLVQVVGNTIELVLLLLSSTRRTLNFPGNENQNEFKEDLFESIHTSRTCSIGHCAVEQ